MKMYDISMKIFKKKCEAMVKEYEDIIIERIAFSLFAMCHYKHRLYSEENGLLLNLTLKELKETWKLGVTKDKVKFFLHLAKQIFEMDLKNGESNNENKKD